MKLTAARNWLKVEDVKEGDPITLNSEGEWVTSNKYTYADGQPKKDFVFKVFHNSVEKDFRLNATNKKALIKAYGDETTDWIGKICLVSIVNVMVSGKMMKSMILIPSGTTKNVQYEA